MRTSINLVLSAAIAALVAPVAAQAQDVVMRRPLPDTKGKGLTQTGTTPTPPTDPDTPPLNPKPTPGVVDPVNPVDDPVTTVCDGATSTDAKVSSVQWIEAGWTAGAPGATANCTTQSMRYVCQATYSCKVDGAEKTFVSEAPDSTCENFDGDVATPPTSYPQTADVDAQAKWVAAKLAAVVAGNTSPPRDDGQKPTGYQALSASGWVRTDMIFYYDHWYTGGWALRVYFNDTPFGPFCTAFAKYSGKRCDNYGAWGTWVYYK